MDGQAEGAEDPVSVKLQRAGIDREPFVGEWSWQGNKQSRHKEEELQDTANEPGALR